VIIHNYWKILVFSCTSSNFLFLVNSAAFFGLTFFCLSLSLSLTHPHVHTRTHHTHSPHTTCTPCRCETNVQKVRSCKILQTYDILNYAREIRKCDEMSKILMNIMVNFCYCRDVSLSQSLIDLDAFRISEECVQRKVLPKGDVLQTLTQLCIACDVKHFYKRDFFWEISEQFFLRNLWAIFLWEISEQFFSNIFFWEISEQFFSNIFLLQHFSQSCFDILVSNCAN